LFGQSRDVNLLLFMRGARGFGYGYLNTVLGLYLSRIGFSLLQVGILVTVAGLSSSALILTSGLLADRISNRKIFIIISSLFMAILGAIYTETTYFPVLLVGAAFGGAGSAGGGGPGGGPFGPAQLALLAEKTKGEERDVLFSVNAFIGTVLFSVGAVVAGLPDLLSSYGIDRMFVYDLLFLVFMAIGILLALLGFALHEEKPEKRRPQRADAKLMGKFTLTAILSGFSMGFLPLPIITLWFNITFLPSEALISLMIGASTVLSAFTFLLAPRLARRLGSVQMIVLTRIVSITLLALLPITSFFSIAAVLYIFSSVFLSIGFPIWQSYMLGTVPSEERASAIGLTSGVGWGIPYAVSPTISTFMMQEINSDLPIYVSAVLQASSITVYYYFFHVSPQSDVNSAET